MSCEWFVLRISGGAAAPYNDDNVYAGVIVLLILVDFTLFIFLTVSLLLLLLLLLSLVKVLFVNLVPVLALT